jgi:hypothetical protein
MGPRFVDRAAGQPRLRLHATRSTRSSPRVIVASMGHSKVLKLAFCMVVSSSGCKGDEPFLPLSALCDDLAEDICDARAGGCCGPADVATCVAAEKARCDAQLATLSMEDLNYDSVRAEKLRRQARTQLEACGPVPVLASFFEEGLVDGSACQRDGQCAGGACLAGACGAATPAALCTAQ